MTSPPEANAKRREYGPASDVVPNMLLDIQSQNKDEQLEQIIAEACEVAVGQQKYVEDCKFPETELGKQIHEEAMADPITSKGLPMLSSHLQVNFLKMLAEMTQAKDILEIGMYVGYGAVNMAESAFCESLVTLDVEPYYEQFVKGKLVGTPLEEKIRIMIGPANDSLAELKNEGRQFDLVFIDANKGGYLCYYKYIMDNDLLKPTGTIACDNILWYGKTFNQSDKIGKVLHEFVEFVKQDERVYQTLLPIRDGILLIKPKIVT